MEKKTYVLKMKLHFEKTLWESVLFFVSLISSPVLNTRSSKVMHMYIIKAALINICYINNSQNSFLKFDCCNLNPQ